LIAQQPAAQRDLSRLLVLECPKGCVTHRKFRDLLKYLRAGDVLVLNDSRVIPARLRALKAGSGGEIEVMLAEENRENDWWAMVRPGKRVRAGTKLLLADRKGLPTEIDASVTEKNEERHYRMQFSGTPNIVRVLDSIGETPL